MVYFFFVLFFLPSFYKKVRVRSLIQELNIRGVFSEAFDSLSSSCVFFENFSFFMLDVIGVIFFKYSQIFKFKLNNIISNLVGLIATPCMDNLDNNSVLNLSYFSKIFVKADSAGFFFSISTPKSVILSKRG